LRAKARHQRWEEELLIVKHEMLWTVLWFGEQKKNWEQRRDNAMLTQSRGHCCYAEKQMYIWESFVASAREEFKDILG
jgi:hypothetical protein